MDRRQVLIGVVGPLVGLGATLLLGSLRPEAAQVAVLMRIIGPVAMALGAGVWLGVFLSTLGEGGDGPDRGFLPIRVVGHRLYRDVPELRTMIAAHPGSPFRNVEAATMSFAVHGAQAIKVPVYGRRAAGLTLEPMPYEDALSRDDPRSVLAFAPWQNISIRKRDVRAIVNYYRQSGELKGRIGR